jgi:hypothetical protein
MGKNDLRLLAPDASAVVESAGARFDDDSWHKPVYAAGPAPMAFRALGAGPDTWGAPGRDEALPEIIKHDLPIILHSVIIIINARSGHGR